MWNMKTSNPTVAPLAGEFYFLVLLGVGVFFIGLEIYAITTTSHYRYDIPMCMFLLYSSYKCRQKLKLLQLDFVLISVFLILHSLGIFDLYTHYPLGIEYDYWVHGMFGIVAALVSMRFFQTSTPYSRSTIAVATILLIMGIAAFHELYEFAGAVLLGKGEGVLFIGAGDLDQWDTHKDILNNLIGGLAGIGLSFLRKNNHIT